MKLRNTISSIELIEVEMPLVHPFRTSFGVEESTYSILVKITDTEGKVGWGETTISKTPGYSYETNETAWHIQRDFLLPKLQELVKNISTPSIQDILTDWESVRGHEMAKGGIEAAVWSLIAEQENVSLGKLYGGSKSQIPTGVSIGIQTDLEKLITRIGSFIDKGYQRIKIKIEPGWDVEPVKRIRQEFGDIKLMVDANSAFSLSDHHIKVLKELDKYEMMMIEQPLAHQDMLDHKKLQAMLDTAICLDESIHSPHDARVALEYETCKIINIKPGRVGGFANAIEIAEIGGKDVVWCGGMLETGIGRLHNLHFQSRSEFNIPGDTSGSDRYYAQDIIEPKVEVDENGFIQVPTGTGLGAMVREDIIMQYTTRSLGTKF